MKGPCRVVFLPIKHGDVVDLNDTYRGKTVVHDFGFKPGPARSRSGWLVLLVHEGEVPVGTALDGRTPVMMKIPKTVRPKVQRAPVSTS